MWIGTKKIEGYLKWSRFNGRYWEDYFPQYSHLSRVLSSGRPLSNSSHQDYTPVMTLQLHRWNDE